jgi:hypothetical protein
MFMAVVQAQTPHRKSDVGALTGAYVMALMPFVPEEKKPPGRTYHERAVNAVRAELREIGEPRSQAASAVPAN